jgi:hypothetical protein
VVTVEDGSKKGQNMLPHDIYQDLPEQIRQGNCVLILGMGIYRGLDYVAENTHLPDQETLARELAERSDFKEEPLNLAKVAQSYEWKFGRQSLIEYIRRRFELFSGVRLPVLESIARLPFKAIITTCFDDLLEKELFRQQRNFSKVYRDPDMPFQSADRLLLLKIYGTLEDPSSIVITRNDQLEFPVRFSNIPNEVKALCSNSTLLFMGFDLEDENFMRLHQEVTDKIARFVRMSYAFDEAPKDFTVEWWKKKNVNILHMKTGELLVALEREVFKQAGIDLEYRELQENSRFQVDKVLAELRRNKYNSQVYAPREIEKEIETFISSSRNGLILIGDSGSGKTNLLIHLAEEWMAHGYIVQFYDCGGSLDIEIERTLIRDLSREKTVSFDSLIEHVARTVEVQNCKLVLIFDGLNEFWDGEKRAADLLKRLDSIIGRIEFHQIKFIVSCRSGTWQNMASLGRTNLFWNRYYPGEDQVLSVPKFSTAEAAVAFEHYQSFFNLKNTIQQLPAKTQERLKDPFLLRMAATVYKEEKLPRDILSIKVLQNYCERQIGQRIQEIMFLRRLAGLMLETRAQAVTLTAMLDDKILAKETSDDPNSALQIAKDTGILTSVGDAFTPCFKFTYDRVLEYFTALGWKEPFSAARSPGEFLEKQLSASGLYSPARGATMVLLLMLEGNSLKRTLLELAGSSNYQCRQVVVDYLIERNADDPKATIQLFHQLLASLPDQDEVEANPAGKANAEICLRTFLKAARTIGTEALEVFLEVASSNSRLFRDVLANESYVLWKSSPEAGFEVLAKVIENIHPEITGRPSRLLDFAARYSLTIFSNSCDKPEMIERLSQIWWDLFEVRFGIVGRLGSGTIHKFIEAGIRFAADRGIANAAMGIMTNNGTISLEAFFKDTAIKEKIQDLIPYLDPEKDLEPKLPVVRDLILSDLEYPNIYAALVLTVHFHHDPAHIQPLLERLFEELEPAKRVWLLLVFMIVTPTAAPDDLILDLVLRLTTGIEKDNPRLFIHGPSDIFDQLDIGLVPLGLAYGRSSQPMSFLDTSLDVSKVHDHDLFRRFIRGIAPVGLYYPGEVLEVLRPVIQQMISDEISGDEIQNELLQTLATMGVLHADQVDQFLLRLDANDAWLDQLHAREDAALIKKYIDALGLYNLIGYGCLRFPRIRKMIQKNTLAFVESENMKDLISRLALAYLDLVVESDYQISNMIR